MGGRALLVFVAGIIMISGSIFFNITRSSISIAENADRNYLRQASQDIAQTGVNMALRQLALSPNWRTGFTQKGLFGGSISVTVRDSTFNSATIVKITSISVLDNGLSTERRDTSIAYLSPAGGGFIPSGTMAAITSNYPVQPQGGALIDGRDHDSTGTFLPIASGGKGTYGIWTLGGFGLGGTSSIGGTFGGVDYTPTGSPGGTIVKQNQVWPNGGTFPKTPDAVLGGIANGFSEGQLKLLAQSKVSGSQYVTDPKKLKMPLTGVTYVELGKGGQTGGIDISGSGILIVHNATGDAQLENPSTKSGSFRGLVVADRFVHNQGTIIGAAIDLSDNSVDIANGNGSFLYSSQVLKSVTASLNSGASSGAQSTKGSAANVIAVWE